MVFVQYEFAMHQGGLVRYSMLLMWSATSKCAKGSFWIIDASNMGEKDCNYYSKRKGPEP